ncbi:hypothetical protein YGS_C1P2701 [Sphingobium sp. YG1]|nr:hypothetical protein YGS_C1P2701 [Sphingobium sp. YG1]
MACLHIRDMSTVVVNFDTGYAGFGSILFDWIKLTVFAEQPPMVENEPCAFFRSKARLSLLL